MDRIFNIFLVHSFTFTLLGAVVAADHCTVTRCNHDDPIIRFPFRLKGHQQPDECSYPGFELSCDPINKQIVLELQFLANTSLPEYQLSYSLKGSPISIDYTIRKIILSVWEFTPTLQLIRSSLNELALPNLFYSNTQEYSFFNCSPIDPETEIDRERLGYPLTRQDSERDSGFQVFMIENEIDTFRAPLTSCTKMYDVSLFRYYSAEVFWSRPDCGDCEAKGEYCKLEKNSTNTGNKHDSTTVCFPKGFPKVHVPYKQVVPGIVGGLFLILLLVALYYVIKKYKQKKEDQLKIEMFLEDYKALKPTRYSYADIRKITNQFREKLGQGGYGLVYKGQLSNDILVAVKVLNDSDSKGNGEDFINEVSTIGLIHHINVVRLVGYCADGSRRALVYEFLPNNSLEKFVYSGKNHNNKFLGWEKLQQIAIGIAKGIEYLHQGCAQKILHFDIKPHNILLDQNFNPKISDFGLAKLCSKGQSVVSMTMARGTIGYIAPEVFSKNFGKVSSKSDVYSFGMLLLEMVGAKNNAPVETESSDETYFPEWIFHCLEQGGELTIQIEEEVDNNIARKLTIVGLRCIGWHPVDRPSMKHVIQMLEAEDCPAIPPNPFSSTSSRNATATTHARPFTKELEAISESE